MTDVERTELRPGDEERIREAVRIAVRSCRDCDGGTDCIGPLMDLFKYLPADVRKVVEDEQSKELGEMVGGD
jgi:hypothetical protein